jgi:hypothetical protein
VLHGGAALTCAGGNANLGVRLAQAAQQAAAAGVRQYQFLK